MTFPHIIPCYSLNSSAVDAVWLTAVILCHAAAFAAASADVVAVLRDEEQRELLRFEAVVVDNDDDDDDDDDSVSNDGTVNSSAPIADHLNSGGRRVFRMPSLRPRQDEAITRIAFDPQSGGKLIVVDPTAGGKSLVLAMTAIVVGGVTIVIVPLLALTADQLTRLNASIVPEWMRVKVRVPTKGLLAT